MASDIDEILKLARDDSVAGRSRLAKAVGDLFQSRRGKWNDAEKKQIGKIIGDLAQDTERSVRMALSRQLAKDPHAPREGVRALANDEIEVAGFVLLNSPVLSDADLAAVINQRSMQHRLAVAGRSTLSEKVTDALIEKGEESVVVKALGNPGAKVSADTMERIVEESQYFPAYHKPLATRNDLSKEQARKLGGWAEKQLGAAIVKKYKLDPNALDRYTGVSSDALSQRAGSSEQQEMKAQRIVDELEEADALNPTVAMKALRQGEILVFETSLSRMAAVPVKTARQILYERRPEYLAVLCKASAFGKEDFRELLRVMQIANNARSLESMNFRYDIDSKFAAISDDEAQKATEAWRRSGRLSLPASVAPPPGAPKGVPEQAEG